MILGDVIGAALILLTAFLAEKAAERYKKWLWAAFVVLVLAQAGLQIYVRAQDSREAQKRQAEIDRLNKKVDTLQTQGEDINKIVHEGQKITVETKTDPALIQLLRDRGKPNLDILKIRTLLLADKLDAFAQRENVTITLPDNMTEEQKRNFRSQYLLQILNLYHTTYEEEALRTLGELKQRGLSTRLHFEAFNLPRGVATDALHPEILADELRRLANRL